MTEDFNRDYDNRMRYLHAEDLRRQRERGEMHANQERWRGSTRRALAFILSLVAIGLGLVAIAAVYDAVLTRIEVVEAMVAVLPDSWTDQSQLWWVRVLLTLLVAGPLWVAAWLVKRIRTAVATATPPGLGAGLLRLGWLWVTTAVRAGLDITALVVAVLTFRLLGGDDPDSFTALGAGGLDTAALLVIGAAGVRAVALDWQLPRQVR